MGKKPLPRELFSLAKL